MSKIIAHAWINAGSTIGVVITYDEVNGKEPYKARIGPVIGMNEQHDLQEVKNWGAKLNIHAAAEVIKHHGSFYDPMETELFLQHLKSQKRNV